MQISLAIPTRCLPFANGWSPTKRRRPTSNDVQLPEFLNAESRNRGLHQFPVRSLKKVQVIAL